MFQIFRIAAVPALPPRWWSCIYIYLIFSTTNSYIIKRLQVQASLHQRASSYYFFSPLTFRLWDADYVIAQAQSLFKPSAVKMTLQPCPTYKQQPVGTANHPSRLYSFGLHYMCPELTSCLGTAHFDSALER